MTIYDTAVREIQAVVKPKWFEPTNGLTLSFRNIECGQSALGL